MALTYQQLNDRIRSIQSHADSTSDYYGRLLNWRGDGAWHYGIGLSDDRVFDTGNNLRVFCPDFSPQFVLGVNHRHFEPDQVIERLICALRAFRNWNGDSRSWNSEHLARLVALDDAISYRFRKGPRRHPRALTDFHEYLQSNAPKLLIRGYRDDEPDSEPELDEPTAGRILGLRGRVTVADIRRAYRERMKEYHPDRVAHLGPDLRELAERKAKQINAAYELLMAKYNSNCA